MAVKRGRPRKTRNVSASLRVNKFSPRGLRGRPDIIRLTLDEIEAIRLGDLEIMKHTEAAGLMNVSRQTFERILKKARHKLADGIVKGKIVVIEDAEYVLNVDKNTGKEAGQ